MSKTPLAQMNHVQALKYVRSEAGRAQWYLGRIRELVLDFEGQLKNLDEDINTLIERAAVSSQEPEGEGE